MSLTNNKSRGDLSPVIKIISSLSIISLALTILFFVTFIAGLMKNGLIETRADALDLVEELDWIFYLTYVNAALLTIIATMLMIELHVYCKLIIPEWITSIGYVFIPIYCAINLFAYLSQISVVPLLVELRNEEANREIAEVFLSVIIQAWPESGVAFFNNLAYAILGIPSIIFGWGLFKQENKLLKYAGAFLTINGIACIIGVIGIMMNNEFIGFGSLVGAIFYLLALIPLSLLFRYDENE